MTHEQRIRVAVVARGVVGPRACPGVRRAARRRAVRGGRPHPARTQARAGEFCAHPYVDLEAMLERERPDLVSLCLPNEGHFNDVDRQFHRIFDKHIDQLLTAFRNHQPPPIHARAGRRALVLAHAIIGSFEVGTRIDVPPDPTT
jgi:Oxidoreductase family, NAD-binding Rossmann fold